MRRDDLRTNIVRQSHSCELGMQFFRESREAKEIVHIERFYARPDGVVRFQSGQNARERRRAHYKPWRHRDAGTRQFTEGPTFASHRQTILERDVSEPADVPGHSQIHQP